MTMETHLEDHTEQFVAGLISIVTALYGPELRRQQDSQAAHEAGGQDGPTATPSPVTSQQEPPASGLGHSTSPAGPSTEDLPGIFYGGSGHPTTTPMSSEEPQEEPGHAAAVGSSTQCRDCLSGGVSESPEKEGQQQPPGLAPTLQEAALAAALSQNPTTSQTTAQADWEASGRWL